MGYLLEGKLLEVCSCASLCPCWVGLEPDNGVCQLNWVMHVDLGYVDKVNMAHTNLGIFGVLTGAFKSGSMRVVGVVDEKDTEEQREVMRRLLRGELEGPLGDAAVGVGGQDDDIVGLHTEITHSFLNTMFGNPAYPGKVKHHEIHDPKYGFEFEARQSTQTTFRYAYL